jgi:hypothetical protein
VEAEPNESSTVGGVYWNDSICDLCFITKASIGANSLLLITGNLSLNLNFCPSICLACRLPEAVVVTIVFWLELIATSLGVGLEGNVPLILY